MRILKANSSSILLVSLIALATSLIPVASQAAGENKLTVSIASKELVLKDPDNPNPQMIVAFAVEGPGAATISVEVMDVALSESNQTTTVAPGSTSYSLADKVGVRNAKQVYRPNGNRQIFKSVIYPKVNSVKGAKFGAITVSMQTTIKGKQSKNTKSAANASFKTMIFMYDFGYKGSLDLAASEGIKLDGISLEYPETRAPIDFLVPDLPFLIHDGPVNLVTEISNKAELPQVAEVETVVLYGGDQIVISKQPRRPLLPNQSNRVVASTLSKKAGGFAVDSLPDFGFITVKSTLVSSIGGAQGKAKSIERTFLVVPWKTFFVLSLIAGVYLWLRFKKKKPVPARTETQLPPSGLIRPPIISVPAKTAAVSTVTSPNKQKSLVILFIEQVMRELKKRANKAKKQP